MNGRGSRGTAGTLRRLAPRPTRRGRSAARCLVKTAEGYLWARSEEGDPLFSPDETAGLPLLADVARQVAQELRNQGYDAELVPAPRGGI